MYETYFGLRKRPFLAAPTLDRYCPIECQELAFATVVRAIQRMEGPVSIVGGSGVGKSMVCLRVADAFRRCFEVIVLASSQLCSRRALLQSLLFELRMPYRDLSEGELRLSLLERLQPSNDNPTDGLVLIVDEAQTLAPKLLEELRLLTNLTRDGVPRVRLVLCGTTRLEEMLGHPQMESLNQRMAARCYLMPLNSQETVQYLTQKIELCGAPISAVITEDAMRLVHRATDGVPRLIDQVVDSAIRIAAEIKQRPISIPIVEAAWARSQQLPLPWSDSPQPIDLSNTSVEFGLLEEDTEQDFKGRDTSYVHRFENSPVQQTVQDDIGELAYLDPSMNHHVEPKFENEEATNFDPEVAFYEESIGITSKSSTPVPPIPSAGSGLSRSISSSWESFVAPIQSNAIDHIESSPLPVVGASVAANELFGMDYDEELWVNNDMKISSMSNDPATPISETGRNQDSFNETQDLFETGVNEKSFDVPIEVVSDDQIDSSLYAFREMPGTKHLALPSMDEFDSELESTVDILDQISTSNLEAMTMSPKDTSPDGAEAIAGNHSLRGSSVVGDRIAHSQSPVTLKSAPKSTPKSASKSTSTHGKLSRPSRASILSFADIRQDSEEYVQDDRDLLVIEEDVLHVAAGIPIASEYDTASQATIHPYKQLFSKLRG